MNICFVCSEYPPMLHGGIGSVTQQIAEGLVHAGHSVHVVGIYRIEQDIRECLNGVQLHCLAIHGNGLISAFYRRWRLAHYLAKLERKIGFDLVETPEWSGDSAFIDVRCPLVVRLHNSHTVDRLVTGTGKPSRLVRLTESLTLRQADYLCSVSAYIAKKTAEFFPNIRSKTCTVIYNSVDTHYFKPGLVERTTDIIGFVGSCKPVKGLRPLLLAFSHIVEQYSCQLEIYGGDTQDISGGSYLQNSLALLSPTVRERIIYRGRVTREILPEVYGRFTVIVLPSLVESFGMVAVEAMACGTPVVLGDCGPHSEIIEDGVDGLICNARDPADIATKTLRLFTEPTLRQQLGLAAVEKVKTHFAMDDLLQKNIDFYQTLIQSSVS